MSPTYQAAVVGLGRQGQRHLESYALVPEIQVTAICDLDSTLAEDVLSVTPEIRGYSDFRAMLDAQHFDIVSIATPAPSHAQIVIAAAEAGVPRILCEKPMATSLEEADAMIAACQRAGSRLSVNHGRRWAPAYLRLLNSLNDGSIGVVRHLNYACGGGRLGSNGTHAFDLIRMLTAGEAVKVMGVLADDPEPDPRGAQYHDPGGFGQIIFDNGARATIDLGSDLGVPPLWTLACTDGLVCIDEMKGTWNIGSRGREHQTQPSHARYVIPMDWSSWEVGPLDIVELTRAAIAELLSDTESSCSGADGRAALEIAVAFHVSHGKNCGLVTLPLPAEHRKLRLCIA